MLNYSLGGRANTTGPLERDGEREMGNERMRKREKEREREREKGESYTFAIICSYKGKLVMHSPWMYNKFARESTYPYLL